MANELTVQFTLAYSKGGVKVDKTITKKITISGSAVSHKTQALTTTKEAIDVGDCGTSAMVFFFEHRGYKRRHCAGDGRS